jgi:hypothetical protein
VNKHSRVADVRLSPGWGPVWGLQPLTVKIKLVTKCYIEPRNLTSNKRPKLRNKVITFGTWNVRIDSFEITTQICQI